MVDKEGMFDEEFEIDLNDDNLNKLDGLAPVEVDESNVEELYSKEEFEAIVKENEELKGLLNQSSVTVENMNRTINELNNLVSHYKFISDLYYTVFTKENSK